MSRRGARVRLVAAAALVVGPAWLVVSGCESAEARSARRVLDAIERLRESDESTREAALARVMSEESESPAAIAAKEACGEAFRALGATQRLVEAAKGPPVDREKLQAAEVESKNARRGLGSCNTATASLRRALGR